jgi:serine protease Do
MSAFGASAGALRRSTVSVDGGSGVIWRPDLIVTNAHVARRERVRVRLWDGETLDAAVIKRDPARDLALLRITVNDAQAANAGDSSALRPGQIVMAVGNPLGFIGALSTGIVHASDRRWVQADVRLAPGNSGGPLADAAGFVVGINTMIAGSLALAIPSNRVAEFIAAESRPSLGVVLQPVQPGLLILEVDPNLPAARASLLPGDILLGFKSPDDLRAAIDSSDVLAVRFLRGDNRVREVAIRLRAAAA